MLVTLIIINHVYHNNNNLQTSNINKQSKVWKINKNRNTNTNSNDIVNQHDLHQTIESINNNTVNYNDKHDNLLTNNTYTAPIISSTSSVLKKSTNRTGIYRTDYKYDIIFECSWPNCKVTYKNSRSLYSHYRLSHDLNAGKVIKEWWIMRNTIWRCNTVWK